MAQKPFIFEKYPELQKKFAWVKLGNFPTPVLKLKNLGKTIGCSNLYLKRDDISGTLYGGNKVRKLEFILADAKRKNRLWTITVGASGSNHCLATTIYAKKLGMRNISCVFPQPETCYLKKNLFLQNAFGGEVKHFRSVFFVPFGVIFEIIKKTLKGTPPYYVPAGGSSVLGCIGYVNAVFELKKQIEDGILPEPDFIFTPAGTCGTAAGLELGTKVLNLKSKIISVRVVDKIVCNKGKISKLVNKTSLFLHRIDRSFPKIKVRQDEICFLDEYFGDGYAKATEKCKSAIKLIKETEGIALEETYTGKTLAALIDMCKKEDIQNKILLFWNTYNSQNTEKYITK